MLSLIQASFPHSRYLQQSCQARPALLQELLLHVSSPPQATLWQTFLPVDSLSQLSELEVKRQLRLARQLLMCVLIVRDIQQVHFCLSPEQALNEVMCSISAFADWAVQMAVQTAQQALQSKYGVPIGAESGLPQSLLVIGMGKLGGVELNVSSDIDLIFAYAEGGETNGASKLSNHEFFTRMGRKIIILLDDKDKDGFVFRVDMRLRPHGNEGALVSSYPALEHYLATQGRQWERFAWLKARLLTANSTLEEKNLTAIFTPFVFRQYLDYGMLAALRALHAKIKLEVAQQGKQHNIKLGAGGIREIEFIAQIFQLMRGGRERRLRSKSTRQTLVTLAELGVLSPTEAEILQSAYIFLRNLEHRLQYLDDLQTQHLPKDDSADWLVLAQSMGFVKIVDFTQAIDLHRQAVNRIFNAVFHVDNSEIPPVLLSSAHPVASSEYEFFADPTQAARQIEDFYRSARYQLLQISTQTRLKNSMAQLLLDLRQVDNPDVTLTRLLNLFEVIGRRESYFSLLAEYPHIIQRLVKIYSFSPWIAAYLTRHPMLLDDLLDVRLVADLPNWTLETNYLQQRLAGLDGDIEAQMNELRHWQHQLLFRLAIHDVFASITVEKLSDQLSLLADAVLQQTLFCCWADLQKISLAQASEAPPPFAIIAYGKLGGKELGYASDLDIIFIYEDETEQANACYARLAKKLNVWLSTHTAAGALYEIDLRLRPDGASGMLVSSLSAFRQYQSQKAWVWEHQALTRARFCAGSVSLGQKFESIRQTILTQERNPIQLASEIVQMRAKMHTGYKNTSGLFDIKQDAGGLVDIEFCVQYLVLHYAAKYQELTANIGNIALLQRVGELGLIPMDLAGAAQNAYRRLRTAQHHSKLAGERDAHLAHVVLEQEIKVVRQLWILLFGE